MPNNRLEIVLDEFLTSIDHNNQFHVNLLFNSSIYRLLCAHMGSDIAILGQAMMQICGSRGIDDGPSGCKINDSHFEQEA